MNLNAASIKKTASAFVSRDQYPRVHDPRRIERALGGRKGHAEQVGRWARYQGIRSRPTAWWWVIVPPPAITVSEARALMCRHCVSSPQESDPKWRHCANVGAKRSGRFAEPAAKVWVKTRGGPFR
jgi:hypothetical protein